MDIIKSIEHEQLKNKVPELKIGNTVRVHVKIKEGNKERIQVFEGVIIKKQGGGVNETFTVRKISYGVGVEKTFLVHSPLVEKVEVVRVGKVRRAKLYYLRDRVGKASKPKEKIGARIENNEITVKEDLVEEEVAEEVVEETVETPVEETVETKATEVAETVKEEPAKVEEKAEEASVEEVKTVEKEETKAEEVKAVEEKEVKTEAPVAKEEKTEAPAEKKEEKVEAKKEAEPSKKDDKKED